MEKEMTLAEMKEKENIKHAEVLKTVEKYRPIYIRYDQGTYLFGVCRHTLMKIVEQSGAKRKIPGTNIVLINLGQLWDYVESCEG